MKDNYCFQTATDAVAFGIEVLTPQDFLMRLRGKR